MFCLRMRSERAGRISCPTTGAAAIIVLLSLALAGRANTQEDYIPAGIDAFQTVGCDTTGQSNSGWDFSVNPIDAGVFDVFSEEFVGWIDFMGMPLDTVSMGLTDTRVQRGPIDFGGSMHPLPKASTWIRMLGLSTQSIKAVRIGIDGWYTQSWVAYAHSEPSEPGTMAVTRTHQWLDGKVWRPAAGYWESELPVQVTFDFVRLADPDVVVSLPAVSVDTVKATGWWVSDALLDMDEEIFVEPGTHGFVPCVAGYPDSQYIEPFHGTIQDQRRGNHWGSCPVRHVAIGSSWILMADFTSTAVIIGLFGNPDSSFGFVVDGQTDRSRDQGDQAYAFRLENGRIYINGRIVEADCRAHAQVEEVSFPAMTSRVDFDYQVRALDEPIVVAELTKHGLSAGQIDTLMRFQPASRSRVIGVGITETVVDATEATGNISYYYDGYKAKESPGSSLFRTGERLKFVVAVYEDAWCTGYFLRRPAAGPRGFRD